MPFAAAIAAIGGGIAELGVDAAIADVIATGVVGAGTGALAGGAISGLEGGNVGKGALTGAEFGGLTGGLGAAGGAIGGSIGGGVGGLGAGIGSALGGVAGSELASGGKGGFATAAEGAVGGYLAGGNQVFGAAPAGATPSGTAVGGAGGGAAAVAPPPSVAGIGPDNPLEAGDVAPAGFNAPSALPAATPGGIVAPPPSSGGTPDGIGSDTVAAGIGGPPPSSGGPGGAVPAESLAVGQTVPAGQALSFGGPSATSGGGGLFNMSPAPAAGTSGAVLGGAENTSVGVVSDAAPAGTAAAAGPTSGKQFLSSLSSGSPGEIGKSALNVLTSNPGAVLSAGGLAYDAMKANEKPAGYAALQSEANAAAGQGAQLQSYITSGTLPPGAQQALDTAAEQAKAQIRSKYANMPGSSSAEAQDLAAVDEAKVTQGVGIAQSLLSSGITEANLATNLYQNLMQVTLQQDQGLSSAITGFGTALAGSGGGNSITLKAA